MKIWRSSRITVMRSWLRATTDAAAIPNRSVEARPDGLLATFPTTRTPARSVSVPIDATMPPAAT